VLKMVSARAAAPCKRATASKSQLLSSTPERGDTHTSRWRDKKQQQANFYIFQVFSKRNCGCSYLCA
jgi:hypothetical protein